jgi:glycosyltransferase involved in cell wall biosynthesis
MSGGTSVLLVDWLGRGGIAQTTESWAIELVGAGLAVDVVTRPERELGSGVVPVTAAAPHDGRIAAHRAVVHAAAQRIRDTRPSVVVVQNYVLPVLELPVYAAARAVGARVVVVVHDHRLHTIAAGTRAGLRRELRRADVVVAHTQFVAEGVAQWTGRSDVTVIPHPAQIGMLAHAREPAPWSFPAGDAIAGHFGVLQRGYKGGSVVEGLATASADGWAFVAMGTGAPEVVPGLRAFPGYASAGALCGAVAASDVVLAPYRFATQSGIVVLGHVLGAVPVVSAVGGIPEQVDDGVDGLLVSPDAPLEAWRAALGALRDPDARAAYAAAGEARAWRDHAAFTGAVQDVVR